MIAADVRIQMGTLPHAEPFSNEFGFIGQPLCTSIDRRIRVGPFGMEYIYNRPRAIGERAPNSLRLVHTNEMNSQAY